jgi:4'-phosphopantetheinyl transferase
MTTISLNTVWLAPPEHLTLPDDEVHVWRASLTRTPSELQSLSSLLAPDEISRAQRFHFEADRASFIVARVLPMSALKASSTVGREKKPTSRPEAKGFRFRLTVSMSL